MALKREQHVAGCLGVESIVHDFPRLFSPVYVSCSLLRSILFPDSFSSQFFFFFYFLHARFRHVIVESWISWSIHASNSIPSNAWRYICSRLITFYKISFTFILPGYIRLIRLSFFLNSKFFVLLVPFLSDKKKRDNKNVTRQCLSRFSLHL